MGGFGLRGAPHQGLLPPAQVECMCTARSRATVLAAALRVNLSGSLFWRSYCVRDCGSDCGENVGWYGCTTFNQADVQLTDGKPLGARQMGWPILPSAAIADHRRPLIMQGGNLNTS